LRPPKKNCVFSIGAKLCVICCTAVWSLIGAATAIETIELAANAPAARGERRRISTSLMFPLVDQRIDFRKQF
jgi:hypothetical protein